MEDFIKNIEKDKIETLLSYLNQYHTLAEPSRAEPSRAEPSRAEPSRAEPSRAEPSRAEIVWAKFKLSQVFFIKSGVRLTKSDMIAGDMPFIGATEFNNGITEFVSNTNASLDKNILGVNYNGSVVENFYHPYDCIFSDDVKRLELKNKDYANKWVHLFLKTAILQQKEKYQYGYKFNAQRMSKQNIMLPTDDNGEPNWAYMENMMKAVEMKKILQILQHYEY
ncbi:restriction endonuclease subunit S [Moraxella bovis]|uniref:restriction endonuclease subunit S n=1 Tax=Moraxella bovis TaxID=476 RepID=UPI00227D15E4|nr:restriction endonuclease subunit S [Moraxella bovis]WAJ73766.1 restriction endonuclease subunit S [Moraxella bovis]